MDNYTFLNKYMEKLVAAVDEKESWNTDDLRQVMFNTHFAFIVATDSNDKSCKQIY